MSLHKRCTTYLCLLLMALWGCDGGGSEGTGVEGQYRSIEGTIRTKDGTPVGQAEVMILDTGETSLSNELGQFEIHTSSMNSEIELEVRLGEEIMRTMISSVSQESQSVSVTIEFDPTALVVPTEALEVSVKIVGKCDIFFDNNRTIRQANPVPPGTQCTAKIVTYSGGKPVGNISYGVRYRGCSEGEPSTEIAAGLTSLVFNPGVGQVTFPFFDDQRHCVYEIRVPYKQPGVKSIVYKVVTFTKQAESQ